MIESFKNIDISSLSLKVFNLIGNDWMLITAGNLKNCNTMTASWGGLGILWGVKTATIYVRPQRYTKEFIDKEEYFTLSFFEEKYKDVLKFCGTNSGRDIDKIKESGLSPKIFDSSVSFEQASLVLICKKIYTSKMEPNGIIEKDYINSFYKDGDFHNIYIGEIKNCYKKFN